MHPRDAVKAAFMAGARAVMDTNSTVRMFQERRVLSRYWEWVDKGEDRDLVSFLDPRAGHSVDLHDVPRINAAAAAIIQASSSSGLLRISKAIEAEIKSRGFKDGAKILEEKKDEVVELLAPPSVASLVAHGADYDSIRDRMVEEAAEAREQFGDDELEEAAFCRHGVRKNLADGMHCSMCELQKLPEDYSMGDFEEEHCPTCGEWVEKGNGFNHYGQNYHFECLEAAGIVCEHGVTKTDICVVCLPKPPGHQYGFVTHVPSRPEKAQLVFEGTIAGVTMRSCLDCGALVAGGPTRCGFCADKCGKVFDEVGVHFHNHPDGDVIMVLDKPGQPSNFTLQVRRYEEGQRTLPNAKRERIRAADLDNLTGHKVRVMDRDSEFFNWTGTVRQVRQGQCMVEFENKARMQHFELGQLMPETPNGFINNCGLANGAPEGECPICQGECPDAGRFS